MRIGARHGAAASPVLLGLALETVPDNILQRRGIGDCWACHDGTARARARIGWKRQQVLDLLRACQCSGRNIFFWPCGNVESVLTEGRVRRKSGRIVLVIA